MYSSVFPSNERRQRALFMQDSPGGVTNPTFVYAHPKRCHLLASSFAKGSSKYVTQAEHILRTVIQRYGSESHYFEEICGEVLSTSDSVDVFRRYLDLHNLSCEIRLVSDAASPTSFKGKCLYIRVPTSYRKYSILGVANHELGTHFIRRLNEGRQIWRRKHGAFDLRSKILSTEEGLATLNTHIHARAKYLWKAALHYYSTCMAMRMTFRDLYDHLEQFIDDPERRWSECLRVKRGISDTTQLGCFAKDQCYLSGAIQLLQNRHHIDFRLLYAGKIHWKDLDKVCDLSVPSSRLVCPFFLRDPHAYLSLLDDIAAHNGIP